LKEERDAGATASWIGIPMTKLLIDFERSLKKYPPIKAGTPDPYVPQKQ
jgi:arylsulfatase